MDFLKRYRLSFPLPYTKPLLMVGFVLIFIIVIVFISRVQSHYYFPIKTVNVYGVKRSDSQVIQSLITPWLKGGFFKANIAMIRNHIRQLPWVSEGWVRRQWPNKLQIVLREKHALAIWNDTNLLTDNGEIFSPDLSSYPDNLPKLIGPIGKQVVMMENFVKINRLLLPLHVKISSLELSPFFTWKLTLTNGLSLQLGHKDILTRLAHFVKVYPKIIGERAKDVEYIDLRYANGMAVRWRAPDKL